MDCGYGLRLEFLKRGAQGVVCGEGWGWGCAEGAGTSKAPGLLEEVLAACGWLLERDILGALAWKLGTRGEGSFTADGDFFTGLDVAEGSDAGYDAA